jgi:hypothetical protein
MRRLHQHFVGASRGDFLPEGQSLMFYYWWKDIGMVKKAECIQYTCNEIHALNVSKDVMRNVMQHVVRYAMNITARELQQS